MKKITPKNNSEITAPTKVPKVPPAAPYATINSESEYAFIKIIAATRPITTWNNCSNNWEIAVGSIVFLPWKNPRRTPIIAKTKIVGERISLDELEKSIEEEKRKNTPKFATRKPKKEEEKVEVKPVEEKKVIDTSKNMAIYTDEELEEFENEDYEDDYDDYDEDIDYTEYDKYYEE